MQICISVISVSYIRSISCKEFNILDINALSLIYQGVTAFLCFLSGRVGGTTGASMFQKFQKLQHHFYGKIKSLTVCYEWEQQGSK